MEIVAGLPPIEEYQLYKFTQTWMMVIEFGKNKLSNQNITISEGGKFCWRDFFSWFLSLGDWGNALRLGATGATGRKGSRWLGKNSPGRIDLSCVQTLAVVPPKSVLGQNWPHSKPLHPNKKRIYIWWILYLPLVTCDISSRYSTKWGMFGDFWPLQVELYFDDGIQQHVSKASGFGDSSQKIWKHGHIAVFLLSL